MSPPISISEIRQSSVPLNLTCDHRPHIPVFQADACRSLPVEQVRAKYPRYEGTCSVCRQSIIVYASLEHLTAGQWA